MKPYYEADGIALYLGDCREVLAELRPVADAVVTDPPYGLSGSSGTINQGRRKAVYRGAWADDLNAVRTVYVPGVVAALARCGGRGAVTPGTPHAFEYPKPDDMAAIVQPCTHGLSKWGLATWQPVLLYGKDPRSGLTIQPLTFTSNGRGFKSSHPCPKADDVMAWLVGRTTIEGQSVLDPFAGSGTTLRAAKDLGRKAIGIEMIEEYAEIAALRLEQQVLDFGGAA